MKKCPKCGGKLMKKVEHGVYVFYFCPTCVKWFDEDLEPLSKE